MVRGVARLFAVDFGMVVVIMRRLELEKRKEAMGKPVGGSGGALDRDDRNQIVAVFEAWLRTLLWLNSVDCEIEVPR